MGLEDYTGSYDSARGRTNFFTGLARIRGSPLVGLCKASRSAIVAFMDLIAPVFEVPDP